jgi:hypothetical protein
MDDTTEYTKVRMQAQRGDGPDRRGKVEVEMLREVEGQNEDGDNPNRRTTTVAVGPDGNIPAAATVDDSVFAEFHYETERAVALLEDRLGLDDDAE